ncbi:MAG: tetratricopeptide repeat protein [Bacteroidia bacterium]
MFLLFFESKILADTRTDSLRQDLQIHNSKSEKNETYLRLLEYSGQLSEEDYAKLYTDARDNAVALFGAHSAKMYEFYRWATTYAINLGKYTLALDISYKTLQSAKCTDQRERGTAWYKVALVQFQKGKSKESLTAIDSAINLFKKVNHQVGLAENYTLKSAIMRNQGKMDESIILLHTAEKTFKRVIQNKDINLLATYNLIGRTYFAFNWYDSALVYYQKCIVIAEKLNDPTNLGIQYNNLGNLEHTRGQLNKALFYYAKSLDIKQKVGNKHSISIALHNVGTIKYDLKQYNEAMIEFRKSMEISNQKGIIPLVIKNNLRIGDIKRELKQIDSALFYHRKALNISQTNKLKSETIESYIAMANDFTEKSAYHLSYEYFKQAYDLSLERDYIKFRNLSLVGIANVYLRSQADKATTLEQKYNANSISELLELAYTSSLDLKDMEGIVSSLDALRNFHHKTGNFEKEAFYSKQYSIFKDSLFNKQFSDDIASYETKLQTAEKEKTIKLLEKDAIILKGKARRRQILYLVFMGLAIVAAVLGYILYKQVKLKQLLKMEKFRNKIANDLHDDVGSTLSSISMYAEILKSKLTKSSTEEHKILDTMSESTSDLMRAMSDIVWTINPKNNTLQSLVTRLKISTIQICESKNIEFKFTSNANLQTIKLKMEESQNIYLVLKEAINNALKYSKCTMLEMIVYQEVNKIGFKIKDNGVGFDISKSNQGNGLRTMKERMTEIGGTLHISSLEIGSEITGEMNLK